MIYEGFRYRILSDPDIAAMLAGKFYPLAAPQDVALPYVTFGETSEEGTPSHSGGSGGLARTVFRIAVWTDNYMESRRLGDLIRDMMDGYKGPAGAGTITSCFKSDARDRYAPPMDGGNLGIFGRETDYRVRYVEAAPTLDAASTLQ